jgi:hypothetical protein
LGEGGEINAETEGGLGLGGVESGGLLCKTAPKIRHAAPVTRRAMAGTSSPAMAHPAAPAVKINPKARITVMAVSDTAHPPSEGLPPGGLMLGLLKAEATLNMTNPFYKREYDNNTSEIHQRKSL